MNKVFKVRYRSITVKVNGVRGDTCYLCPKPHVVKPRGLHLHHFKYAYTVKQVKENPQLALENTVLCCFHAHRVLNSKRIVEENAEIIKNFERMVNKV